MKKAMLTYTALLFACTTLSLGAAVKNAALILDNPKFLDLAQLPDLKEAANQGLSQYRALATPENASSLGLAKSEDAIKSTLGKPKRDFLIRLDALQAFKAGGDIEALLVDTKIVHYPLFVDAKPQGSLTFSQGEGAWTLISMGDVQRTALRQSAIGNSVKRFQKNEEDHFIVRVPALNLEFTAFRDASGALQLASVTDDEKTGLIAGEAESATRVIARLLPLAVKHDGLPR